VSAPDQLAEAIISGFGKMIPVKRAAKVIVAGGVTHSVEELRRWADKSAMDADLNGRAVGALLHELLDVYEATAIKPKKPEPKLVEVQAEVKDLTDDIKHAVGQLQQALGTVSPEGVVELQLLKDTIEELKASIGME